MCGSPHIPLRRERYVRLDIMVGPWNVCPGMEWRGDDDVADLGDTVAALCHALAGAPDVPTFVEALSQSFDRVFPGRAWFVEVEDAPGRWVQVYQPYGARNERWWELGCRETQSGPIPYSATPLSVSY